MSWYDIPRPIVPDLIVQHGRNQRSKPALLEGARRLDWGQFDAATNQVANGLLQLGLVPGKRLAVLMSNSIEMALLLFGAGKAGVSVVPLSVAVADQAVTAMMRDSGAAAVAASTDHFRRIDALMVAREIPASLPRVGVGVPATSSWLEFDSWCQQQSSLPPDVDISSDTECNIIYSSGTTGLPKASCTARAAACTGPPTWRLPCAIKAVPSPSVRSGCTRTSAGSRCSAPCWRWHVRDHAVVQCR